MATSNFVSSLKSVTVLVNRRAGRGRSVSLIPEIRSVFEAAGCHAHFLTTETVEEFEFRARSALESRSDSLIALGGDGTLQALANATQGSNSVLGILPGGGGNDFAAALGLPLNAVAAAKALVGGKPRWIDLVRARTSDGRERLYVGGGGMGLDAEAARQAASRWRRLPGRSRYIAGALQALCSYRPLKIRAEFPGSNQPPVEAEALLAAVLNTPSYGGGIRLAPDAQLDNGALELVMVEAVPFAEALTWLPGLVTNGELRSAKVRRVRTGSVRLSANRECLFHGDGELLGPAPVEIQVLPRAMRILAPRRMSEQATYQRAS